MSIFYKNVHHIQPIHGTNDAHLGDHHNFS